MTAFTPKKLPGEDSWGEKLRQARLHRNLKIEDITKKINIRAQYLIALEEERFDVLPTGLYGKNFLREYALFLKLKPGEFLKNMEEKIKSENINDPFSQKIVGKNKFIIFPKIIRNMIVAAAVLTCLLYLVFYCKKIISPPELIIISPEKNIMTSERSLIINGQTESEVEVKINNEIVLNNYNGYFSQIINLKNGLNNVIITAKKKYSQEKTITRQILVQ